jgi:hypothetical protein
MSDTYVEVIGNVVDASTIKMMACINLGSELGVLNSAFNMILDINLGAQI